MSINDAVVSIGYAWDTGPVDIGLLRDKLKRDRIDETIQPVLFVRRSYVNRRVSEGGITVIDIASRGPRWRWWYEWFGAAGWLKVLKEEGVAPKVIVIRSATLARVGRVLAKKYQAPLVLFVTNLATELVKTRRFGGLRRWYQSLWETYTARVVNHICVINEATKQYVLKTGVPAERITVFVSDTLARDASYIREAPAGVVREELGIGSDERVLLSVGRLEPEKNFAALIIAFSACAEAYHLVICGEGSLRPELEQLIKKHNLEDRVHLVGYVSRKEIWSYYKDADHFVLLSLSEALGLVVWEAMYMKVPVLVSRAAGFVESVGDDEERGWFYDESRPLSEQLHTIGNDKERDLKLAEAHDYVADLQSKSLTFDAILKRIL